MLCFYATSGKNPNTVIFEGTEDNTAKGDVILWNENTTFNRDFYEYLWDIWDREQKKKLYCIVQYLELKEGIQPSKNSNITRELVEKEYDLIGYGVIRLNDKSGKFIFGTFTVQLFSGPIFVEERLDNKNRGHTLKITIQQPGEIVHPMAAIKPTKIIPPEIRKQMDAQKTRIMVRQNKRNNIKNAEEDYKRRMEEEEEEKDGERSSRSRNLKTPKSKGGIPRETPEKGRTPRSRAGNKTPKYSEDGRTPRSRAGSKTPGSSKRGIPREIPDEGGTPWSRAGSKTPRSSKGGKTPNSRSNSKKYRKQF
jgi:hypothetical protein